VQRGARRIASESFHRSTSALPRGGLDDAAFLNRDGSEVLLAYKGSQAPTPFAVLARWLVHLRSPAAATTTFIWRPDAAHSGS
jgi:hypothetical protein